METLLQVDESNAPYTLSCAMPPVASVPGGRVQERYERKHGSVLCFETLLGASSWVDSMFVWFAAAWMPLVVEAIRAKNA